MMRTLMLSTLFLMLLVADPLSAAVTSVDTTHMEKLSEEIIAMTASKDYAAKSLQLYNEANAANSEKYRFNALKALSRLYFNSYVDSFYKYCPLYEASAFKLGYYEDVYRARAWYIYQLIYDHKINKASAHLNRMLREAKKMSNPRYYEMAEQTLAFFYNEIGRTKESYALRERLYRSMEQRDADAISRVNLLRELIHDTDSGALKLKYLGKFKFFLDQLKEQHKTRYNELLTMPFMEEYYYHNLAAYYLNIKKDPHTALSELLKAQKNSPVVAANNLRLRVLFVQTYYQLGDYQKALDECNRLIAYYKKCGNFMPLRIIYRYQSDILHKMHRSDEAYAVRLQYEHLQDSLSNKTYMSDLAKVQAQLDVNQLEIKNKQNELDAAHSKEYAHFYMWGGISLTLVVIILLILVCNSRKETRRVRKEREQADKMAHLKMAFYANMNHEIRTPLNAIDGYSQLIVEEDDPKVRQQYYEIINHSNELLQRLVSEVLDLSKLEAGAITFFNKPCDIPSLMHELYDVFKLRLPANVKLLLGDCPSLILVIDRNRLVQVITNLFNNAAKHTSEGQISFGYEVQAGQVRFYVEDTGIGISADKLNVIFDQYVQLTSSVNGVGLGLSICKGIVDQMGGQIGVSSVEGKGSTFWFLIPQTNG